MAGAAPTETAGHGGKKAVDAELNLVPFIDLLSCCISFLLITAVWTQISALQVASSGGPPNQNQTETTTDVKLSLTEKGYGITVGSAVGEIPKLNGNFDRQALTEKLKALKGSLPEQTAITVVAEDAIAYDDLVNTVDTCLGAQLRNVTVAPLN